MLSPDVRVEGFSAEEWLRLADLMRGPAPVANAGMARGGIVALTTGLSLRKLLSTRTGRLERKQQAWPMQLPELARLHQASWAVKLSTGCLERIADQFGDRIRPSDTYLSQILELLRVLREVEAEGGFEIWPWPIADFPIVRERAVIRALDLICPEGRVALLGVFARGELYTCVAARRGPRGVDAIIGPGELIPEMGLLSGDWQRDYRFLAEAARKRVGPLGFGCFGELYTFQTLLRNPPAGAWTAAIAGQDVVLSPLSPALAVPLGLDAGRVLLQSVRGLAGRLGASDWLSSLSPRLEHGMPIFENDVKAWLGFDPLRLLYRILARRS